jgi:hypothetical protein
VGTVVDGASEASKVKGKLLQIVASKSAVHVYLNPDFIQPALTSLFFSIQIANFFLAPQHFCLKSDILPLDTAKGAIISLLLSLVLVVLQ